MICRQRKNGSENDAIERKRYSETHTKRKTHGGPHTVTEIHKGRSS